MGVTGGIATGKTSLVAELARGGPSRVVNADRIGHTILARPEIARSLGATFGSSILDAEGRIVRARLGSLAFADRGALERLNAIVHPPLLAELREQIDGLAAAGFAGMVVIDAALLVEWDLGGWCDCVVAVVSRPEIQIERLGRDRGLAAEEASHRLALQLPHEARARAADFVLENDGPLERFEADARELARRVWERARRELAGRAET